MSLAICVVTTGSIPNCCSPIKASPESFSGARPEAGDIDVDYIKGKWSVLVASDRFPELEPHEAGNGDVLAHLRDRSLDDLADCGLRIPDRRLVEKADLLVEAVEFSLDDLLDHGSRLVLAFHLTSIDPALALEHVRGHVFAAHVLRAGRSDVHGDFAREILKVFGAGDEVGLAVHLH